MMDESERAELEALRRLVKSQAAEIAELRIQLQLKDADLRHLGVAPARGYREEYERALREIEALKANHGQARAMEYAPLLEAAQNAPDKAHIRLALLATEENAPGGVHTLLTRVHQFANLQAAYNELFPQLAFILQRIPAPADLGNMSLPGISDGHLLRLLAVLYRLQDDADAFNQKRREVFDYYWELLQREQPQHDYGKDELRDRFHKIVRRVGDAMEKRTRQVSLKR